MSARRLPAVLAIVLCLLAGAPAGHSQGVLGGVPETSLEGRVAEVFGTRFVIETERGRILVDPLGADRALPLGNGERVTAFGSLTEKTLLTHRIIRPDGAVVYQQTSARPPGSPAGGQADVAAALAELKLTPTEPPVRKKHHTEVTARTADGRTVYVSFDRFGRLDEIEDAVHDKHDARPTRNLAQSDYQDIARRAGFQPLDDFEMKKHHAVVLTRNRAGELVELHIDRAGYIYKQVWVR